MMKKEQDPVALTRPCPFSKLLFYSHRKEIILFSLSPRLVEYGCVVSSAGGNLFPQTDICVCVGTQAEVAAAFGVKAEIIALVDVAQQGNAVLEGERPAQIAGVILRDGIQGGGSADIGSGTNVLNPVVTAVRGDRELVYGIYICQHVLVPRDPGRGQRRCVGRVGHPDNGT